MQIEEIKFGNTYHIFNRGNNSQDIFFEEENYIYFLKLLNSLIPQSKNRRKLILPDSSLIFLMRILWQSTKDLIDQEVYWRSLLKEN